MKHLFTLSLFILLSVWNVRAQDEKPKKIPKHKTVLSIGLTASPDVYIYDFKANPNFTIDYKTKFNYSAGITVVYYPVKFLSLRASVLYSTKGFNLDYNYTATKPSTNPDTLVQTKNLIADYIDIPIILHLNLIHKDRIQLFLAAGVVPGVLVKKAQDTFFKDNTQQSTTDLTKNFNQFLAGTVYSIGFKYNFSAKFGIGIDPYFRYYLNRIEKNVMSGNPVSFGTKVSLYINFIHKHHRGNWGK
jgi:hypothetical protein